MFYLANTSVSGIVDATGRMVNFGYDGLGRLITVNDPLSRGWTFGYTSAGDLWYVTDPAVGFNYSYRAFAYNGSHDIIQAQDHNNNQSFFGYNANDSLAWAQDPIGNRTNFSYGANATTITDPNSHVTVHTYAAGQLISVTDPLGMTEAYSYDNNDILYNKKDKNNYTWTFSSHFSNGTSQSARPMP